MELQWPLIIFTTFVAWSAGLFASQCALALKKEGRKAQISAWVCSAVLLVVGGIAVFFHLQHWERIFNGFGHLTSGITQELICIVVLAATAVLYLIMLRQSEDGSTVPRWTAIAGIVASVLLVVVMAHSYMMPARPAWNSVLWILAVLGNACVLGPATMVLLCIAKGEKAVFAGLLTLVGAAVNAVATTIYAVALQVSANSFVNMGYYFDPTSPTRAMLDVSSTVAAQTPLLWAGAVAIGALGPLACALAMKKKAPSSTWKIWGSLEVAFALVGAVCLRAVFYGLGLSIFTLY